MTSTQFSFYRVSTGYQGFTSRYKAVINRDCHTGRRHIKVFDRTAFGQPPCYQDAATSTQGAKVLANQWLAGQGSL